MNGRFLLDTNIIISIFKDEEAIKFHLENANEIFIPVPAVGELYYGAFKSSNVNQNISKIQEFVIANSIVECDAQTATIYGKIKNNLKMKGRPIPENDIWISALSLQYDLTLVTRDLHFNEVNELKIETWFLQ